MKAKLLMVLALAACGTAVSIPVEAHHAVGSVYESNDVTIKGVVTNLEWVNPHSILSVDVKNANGGVDQWFAEILPPAEMARAGWTKDSIKPGDEVTLTGRPGKNAQKIMWLQYLVTADGRKLGRKP